MRWSLLGLFLVLIVSRVDAETILGANTSVIFATKIEAQKVLGVRDDFIQRLSPFDRSARLKTTNEVSEAEFLDFVQKSALEWTGEEKSRLQAAFTELKRPLERFGISFPNQILLIKTTGDEEGNAAYTRGAAIVIPLKELRKTRPLETLICHELFHIFSRQNSALREKMYEAIGFKKCNEIEFPAELKLRKITNPDAPKNDHYILLSIEGKPALAVPILFANRENYDLKRGGEFFDYLEFQFLLVEEKAPGVVSTLYDGRSPRLASPGKVEGFFEQVGKNTQYIIHPEEIIADNFVLLVREEGKLSSPEIVQKISAVLLKK